MKNNLGLPNHIGTMPKPLNVTPPGAIPEEPKFTPFAEGVDHMMGRFLKRISNRSLPASRAALEVVRTLEKNKPERFARLRALPDFPEAAPDTKR